MHHRFKCEVNMKSFFKKFLLLTVITAIVATIICFIFSSLGKSGIMTPETSSLTVSLLGILIFFFYSFFLGMIVKKKGWLIGLILAAIYGTIAYSLAGTSDKLDLVNGIMIGIKVLSLFLGAIIGVNFKSKK